MKMNYIKKIKKKSYEIYDKESMKYHIEFVVKFSEILAGKLNADKEICIISAYLHDIGRYFVQSKAHEEVGAIKAEEILNKLNYPEQKIKQVKECILKHSTRTPDKDRKNIEEKILANADAMAHIEAAYYIIAVPYLYRGKSFEQGFYWFKKKIDRDYNGKLTLQEAKKLIKPKFFRLLMFINDFERLINQRC
jgi:uncharacterized protein